MHIQKNLAYLKEKNKYSYEKISKNTGLNVRTLHSIVKGSYKNITIMTVIKLTKLFEISIDDFVFKDLVKENVPESGTKGGISDDKRSN